MSMTKEKCEVYKNQLLAKREFLLEDLRLAKHQIINDDVSYTDAVDQAAAEMDRSFMLQLKNRERDTLWQIDEALRRLDEGNYGFCERCDDPISDGRMHAFPFTTVCIDCKSEIEQEEQRFQNRHM